MQLRRSQRHPHGGQHVAFLDHPADRRQSGAQRLDFGKEALATGRTRQRAALRLRRERLRAHVIGKAAAGREIRYRHKSKP